MWVRPWLGATLLVLAMAVGLVWMSAHATVAALHDDGTVTRLATAAVADPAVRTTLGHYVQDGVVKAASARGVDVSGSSVLATVTRALTSEATLTATAPAWIAAMEQIRVTAVTRLDSDTPPDQEGTLSVDLAPIAKSSGVSSLGGLAGVLGLVPAKGSLTIQIASAEQMKSLKTRYRYLVVANRGGGWLALVLFAAGILCSRRRLWTLVIAAAAAGVIALVVRPLLQRGTDGLTGLGDWGVLARPVAQSVTVNVVTVSTNVAIGCGVVAAVGLVAMLLVYAVRSRSSDPTGSTHAQV